MGAMTLADRGRLERADRNRRRHDGSRIRPRNLSTRRARSL